MPWMPHKLQCIVAKRPNKMSWLRILTYLDTKSTSNIDLEPKKPILNHKISIFRPRYRFLSHRRYRTPPLSEVAREPRERRLVRR